MLFYFPLDPESNFDVEKMFSREEEKTIFFWLLLLGFCSVQDSTQA